MKPSAKARSPFCRVRNRRAHRLWRALSGSFLGALPAKGVSVSSCSRGALAEDHSLTVVALTEPRALASGFTVAPNRVRACQATETSRDVYVRLQENGYSVTRRLTLRRSSSEAGKLLILALLAAIPVPGIAQISAGIVPASAGIVPASGGTVPASGGTVPASGGVVRTPDPLDWKGKLKFHAKRAYGPLALVGMAAYAGFLQEVNSPKEWGQGKRLRRALRLHVGLGGHPRRSRFWAGHGAAPRPALLSIGRNRILAPGGTCGPGNLRHANRCRRRDTGHLALRQRLRRSFPFRYMVSGPSR